jgi:ABC-type phosphate transport system substrate-binding protein
VSVTRTSTPTSAGSPLCTLALALAAAVGLSLLASACGGHSSGAKVAQVGTNKDTKSSGSSNASGSGDPVAYSACMRSHGVGNFPDPDSNQRSKTAVSAGGRGAGVDVHSP